MLLEFTKMNGAGNDFIVSDNRSGKIKLSQAQIARLCDRHRGVGADGVMLLISDTSQKADWAWDFFNSDGSRAAMCGNGARCFARFIQKIAGAKDQITFATGAGIIAANFQGERVTVGLTAPKDWRLNQSIPLSTGAITLHSLNTGVEHAVVFVENTDAAMVQSLGAEIRRHPHFAPRGTNANFVQVLGENFIRVRTYERGVEGETLACGTGVTASALIAARLKNFRPPVKVQVQSGDILEVSFVEKNGALEEVTLSGPADFVFEGQMEI